MHEVYQIKLLSTRREVWIKLISLWEASGLTAKRFCDRERLNVEDLRRWRYRMGNKVAKKAGMRPDEPMQFIPLNFSSPFTDQSEHKYIDLLTDNHYRVRLYQNFPESVLVQLMTVLKRSGPC